MNTICHVCGGNKLVVVFRAALGVGAQEIHTAPERQHCKVCDGTGVLPGLVPPV